MLQYPTYNMLTKYRFDPAQYKDELIGIITAVASAIEWDVNSLHKILKRYPKDGKHFFGRDHLIAGYAMLVDLGLIQPSQTIKDRIKMKPIRTQSGVATVTVLTKPFPCPGKCIFCPNDVRMPKSYLSDEPGAQRAEMNNFDPYLQTYNRLKALESIGHNTEKVELIILGGTWSFYPEEYQIWFVKRCFDAMNDFGVQDGRSTITDKNLFRDADQLPNFLHGKRKSYNEIISSVALKDNKKFFTTDELATWDQLFESHTTNESSKSRCVGLVIETRPDYIDEKEVIKIRKLGATKVQIGIQSLDDTVMDLNKRGHGRKETETAIKLLRQAGFKIHAHWMPNLYGSSVENDIIDYKRLWEKEIRPDELKIYPMSIIKNTEVFDLYEQGKFTPYSYEELLQVLTNTIPETPRYCRLTRIVRDIPSTDIVAGNKLTNFRQIAELELKKAQTLCQDIRSREIKSQQVEMSDLELEILKYESSAGDEIFLSYRTIVDDKIVGFLRLHLPRQANFIPELDGKAIIREIHVYGQVVGIGKKTNGKSQHLGLGTLLIHKAKEISSENGFKNLAVISSIGTREYYKKKGFEVDGLYMSTKTSL
jgi:elongator complex protein 3